MKKKLILFCSVVLCLGFFKFGVASAFFTYCKSITNVFQAGTVKYNFTEEFCSPKNWNPGDCTPKVIHINNCGTKAIYVRFKLCPKWECNLPVNNISYTLNNPNWVKVGDYYYYKKILGSTQEHPQNPTCIIANLKVCFLACSGNEYQGKKFMLEVKTEGVQAKNNSIPTIWGLSQSQINQIGFEAY
jgi:hypothetical protein